MLLNDPLEAEPDLLAQNRVLLTVVGGQIEYCKSSEADLCPGFSNRDPVRLPDTRPPVSVRWLVGVLLVAIPLTAMLLRKRQTARVLLIGAWAGIVAGIIWLGFLILFEQQDDDSSALIMIPAFLMAMRTAGIASRWKQGRMGVIGLWLALAGAISLSEGGVVGDWFQSDLGWGLFMVGMLTHLASLTVFGFANVRGRVFPQGNALPFVMGLLTGLIPIGLAFILTFESDVPFILILGGLGVGWLLMGILLLTTRTGQDDPAEPG